jgi:hypothetical protein
MPGITNDPRVSHEWEIIGDVMITRTTGGAIPMKLWEPFIRDLKAAGVTRLLALVVGPASINTSQRQGAADTFRTMAVEVVVISDDRMVRGIITALSWLGANVKGFAWNEFEKALGRLSLEGTDGQGIMQIALRCRDEMRS